jgi:hypothetical protein
MNPPGEQLVRDYLNRLAVAARGRLGHRDRQGLLERTRAHIEVECGGLRDASAEQVRRALAAMGEPIALVEKERARIAADKSRTDAGIGGLFAGRKHSVVRQVWPAPDVAATAEAGGHANGRAAADDAQAALGRLQVPGQRTVMDGAPTQPAVSVPEVTGVPAGSELSALPAGSANPSWPHESNGNARGPGQPDQQDGARPAGGPGPDGSTGRRGILPRAPLPRRAPSGRTGAGTRRPALPPGRPVKRDPDQDASCAADAGPAGTGDDGGQPDEPASGIEFDASAADSVEEYEPGELARLAGRLGVLARALAGWLGRLGTELVAVMVRDPLEAIAVALLGLGGAIYPPIWLIGVPVAMSSRKWDHRDKWLGLAVPVFLVIFAAMLVVVLGGQRQTIGQYTMEFWVAAGRLSRLVAVLGAGYLLSRAIKYQGTRIKREPNWTQRGRSK